MTVHSTPSVSTMSYTGMTFGWSRSCAAARRVRATRAILSEPAAPTASTVTSTRRASSYAVHTDPSPPDPTRFLIR